MSERLSLERTPGNPPELPEPELEALSKLYARVFAEEPWNEYTVCPTSGTFFGMDTKPEDNCPEADCGATLQPAYPLEQTKDYITRELTRSDAALLLLRDQERDGSRLALVGAFPTTAPKR